MIDNFALAVSHGLLILAVWRLLARPDLDDDAASPDAVKAKLFVSSSRSDEKGRGRA